MVDISGIDKLELIKALWKEQVVARFFALSSRPAPVFDEAEARELLESRSDVDYVCGRAIKVDFSSTTVDPHLYDRDAGAGKFAAVVASLRRKHA